MREKKSWLDALKETLEEKPQLPRENSENLKATTVQNVRKSEEKAGGEGIDINTTYVPRTEDERHLLADGWSPKERMGLTIWANPESGFYFSQEVALHYLDQRSGA